MSGATHKGHSSYVHGLETKNEEIMDFSLGEIPCYSSVHERGYKHRQETHTRDESMLALKSDIKLVVLGKINE